MNVKGKSASMMEKYRKTLEERRNHLKALLTQERQGSAMELHIDLEMRLLLAHYDDLTQRHAHVLEQHQRNQATPWSPEHIPAIKPLLTEEQTIRTMFTLAGDLLDIESTVIAACLSTIFLHHIAYGESSFEPGYPLLRDYFTGKNSLLLKHLGFFTKEDVLQLLDIRPDDQERP